MRVIITGGSGMIGTALAKSLAAAGHEVIVLSRTPPSSQSASTPPSSQSASTPLRAQASEQPGAGRAGIRAELWDGRTATGWGKLADGAGAIVNLAGESIAGANPVAGRWTDQRKKAIRESRVNAGRAVMEAIRAAKQKPGVLVQASAVGYYGPHGDELVTEATPAGSDFLAGVCVDWEASTAQVTELGVRRAVSRTGILLSNDGGAFPPLKTIAKLGAGGPMGSGKQYWPWIHMADVIGALRFMIDSGANGAFNVCAPNPVTNAQFFKTLGQVVHRPSGLPTPAFALRLMAGELADGLLLSGQRQVPAALEGLGFKFKFTELEAALKDLTR